MQVRNFIKQSALESAARAGLGVALVLAGASAAATETRDFPIPSSVLTRAQVKAEIVQAQHEGRVLTLGEATEFALPAVQPTSGHAGAAAQARRAEAQPGREGQYHGG